MRLSALCLALTAGILLAADAKDDKKELEKFQGTWALVSAEIDGKKTPEDEVKKTKLTVAGSKFSLPGAVGTSQEGTFTIDPSKKPKHIDSTATEGPNKGKTFLGIYEMDGEQQKVCFAPPGKERPKEFASPAGSGQLYQVWKRAK